MEVQADATLESVEELPEFNGTVIYNANPVLHFNRYTAQATQLPQDNTLKGSAQFATAAKITDGDRVRVSFGNVVVERVFELDSELKGTVALNPVYETTINSGSYRFEKSKIERVVQ